MNHTYEGDCKLCERFATTLSEHHLIPRTTHSNSRVKKRFSRVEMCSRKAEFCHPCHKAVHSFFTNKELALEMNTVTSLRQHTGVCRHIEWVRKQEPGFRSKGRVSNQKSKRY